MGLSGNAQVVGSLIVATLTVTGNAGAFQLMSWARSDYIASTSNWISNGILTVAVQDDTGNGLDPNELARLTDAMSYLNETLASFGVNLSWASDGTPADVDRSRAIGADDYLAKPLSQVEMLRRVNWLLMASERS